MSKKLNFLVFALMAILSINQAWGAAETLASFSNSSNTGWTISGSPSYSNSGGYQLVASTMTITSPSIDFANYKNITITITGRKYGGPNATQGKISVKLGSTSGTELATYSPSGTTLTASSALSISPTGNSSLVIYCPGASSSKGCGISSIIITGESAGPACTNPAIALSITSAATATVGTPLSLTTTGGNGGAVTWSVTNGTGSATVDGSTLNPATAGTVTVKAHQDQNGTTCEQDAEQTITISRQTTTITLSEAGSETNVSGTYYVGESYTLPSTTDATCNGKVLVGWSTVQIPTAGAKPVSNYYEKGASVTLGATNKFYAVFATASAGGTSTVVNFTGGTSADLTALDYVSASGLGSDYAAGNAPYRVKLDGTGDYILLSLPSVPTSIAIDVKMLGGATASSIKLQECATSNGTFTDVETMSISGSQNDVIEFASTKTYSQKYIKLLFTKGSNVGLGKLVVEAGGTTYTDGFVGPNGCEN